MAARMKIFQTVQKQLASIGYRPNARPFNSDIVRQCLKYSLLTTGQVVYLFNFANTPTEFINSVFVTAIGILVLSSFISTAWKMKTIFIFIEETEEVINGSEFALQTILFKYKFNLN